MSSPRLHIHLRTTDLDASRAFYTALLGDPDKIREDLVRFQPDDVALSLSLMPGEPRPAHPEEHLGLKWADGEGARRAWARLADAGLVAAYTEESVNCCSAVQDKQWFVDPDGRPWEIYAVLDDAPHSLPVTVSSPGCCGQQAAPEPAPVSQACCA